jgi:type IV secretory pathway VirB10-like protein
MCDVIFYCRPRPGQSSSFGSFLSGFLGSVTKTAKADGCPGKCIHALASLMCDSVLENIQCPATNMRCCVEKSSSKPKPPPRENKNPLDSLLELELPPRPEDKKEESEENEEKPETTTEEVKERKKKKKRRKTTTTTTTTTEKTTTEKESEEDDGVSASSSLSRFHSSHTTLSLVCVSLLTFLQTFKNT